VEACQAHGLVGVAGLVLDCHLLFGFQQEAKPGAHERVVLDDHDADHDNGASATDVITDMMRATSLRAA
jgi:hypothetical protein